ncbi:MAG: FtsH protease activity modulator HflK [Planctomycetota bacterium]
MTSSRLDESLSSQTVLGALRETARFSRWGFVLLGLLYLGSGITRVAPNENALVLRFGELQPRIHPPGVLLTWPAPIDEVVRVPVRSVLELRLDAWGAPPEVDPSVAPAPATMHPIRDGYTLTGDANLVHPRLAVRYQIVDPVAAVLSVKERDALLEGVMYRSLAIALARSSVDAALATERDLVRQETQRLAQDELDLLGTGLQLVAVEFRELLPARRVLPAFREVVNAQVEAKTRLQEAETYRAKLLPEAEAEAYRIRQEATAESQGLVARARGEAAAFTALLEEYRKAPALTKARLHAETLEVVGEALRTVTVLPDSPGQLWLPTAPVSPR